MLKKGIAVFLVLVLFLTCTIGCNTTPDTYENETLQISSLRITNGERITICIGEELQLELDIPSELIEKIEWKAGNSNLTVSSKGLVTGISEGKTIVKAIYKDHIDDILIEVIDYNEYFENVAKEEFYSNYKPASSYHEAKYRTENGLMSGSIEPQDQKPYISPYQPSQNGLLIRNTAAFYKDDGNTYVVIDSMGNTVTEVYRGGAYITLEEVAAYVFAFGETPANYIEGKNMSPSSSIWGEFLRLNHTAFSGNTQKYPYEPVLPNISGCGGDLYYYEIDIGTTGTDCDPGYVIAEYNDGIRITRGAARIVYTRYDANRNEIIDINEKFLFYTYNHYNDFQEYLNYYGGWGEMFGNITGGGVISSKTNYNPTQYIPTLRMDITSIEIESDTDISISIIPDYILFSDLYYTNKRQAC